MPRCALGRLRWTVGTPAPDVDMNRTRVVRVGIDRIGSPTGVCKTISPQQMLVSECEAASAGYCSRITEILVLPRFEIWLTD
jgi:hypothetical protein